MSLFKQTLSGFDDYLKNKKLSKSDSFDTFDKSSLALSSSVSESVSASGTKSPLILEFNESDLNSYFSPSPLRFSEITIGSHPDFEDLGHDETEHHYATALFMDIKGSTRLINVASNLEELRRLKDTILTLAINVCNYFGGHVQRLQGDGIFVLFSRKNYEPNDAIIGSLNAASVLTYFIKYELTPRLNDFQMGGDIKIRTGIDFGDAKDVLWSHYGIPGCGELTTTSLHTDLAAKLQQKANSNGIMIGDNIVNALDLEKYFSVKTYISNGETKVDDRYRVSNSKSYKIWRFDWEAYLVGSYSTCHKTENGIEFKLPRKRLKCVRKDNSYEYFENSYSLPKGIELEFTILDQTGVPLYNYPKEDIRWRIVNTGKEADGENNREMEVEKSKDEVTVTVNTKYLGHHKLECIVGKIPNKIVLEFHVFVSPDKFLGTGS